MPFSPLLSTSRGPGRVGGDAHLFRQAEPQLRRREVPLSSRSSTERAENAEQGGPFFATLGERRPCFLGETKWGGVGGFS